LQFREFITQPNFLAGVVMAYMIESILDSIALYITNSLFSLKIGDWVFILIIAGLVVGVLYSIYKDRRNKKEGNIEFYNRSGIQIPFDKLENGKYKISLLGITLESLNQKIFSITNILKNSEIQLLICNPNSPLLSDIEKMVNAKSLQSRIQNTISEINTISNSQLKFKLYDFIPTHSMIIVESKDDDKNSFIQLEPYSYGLYQEERKIYYITKKKNKKLFKTYENSYDKMWTDAKQVTNQT
jgi:hypothetical protein